MRPATSGVRLSPHDVLATRAVVSPLSQLLVPLVGADGREPSSRPRWADRTRRAVREGTTVLRVLLDTVPPEVAIGLLVPPLPHQQPGLADQVAALARVPGRLVQQVLGAHAARTAAGRRDVAALRRADPARVAPTLAREVDAVWRGALASTWADLEGDLHAETSRVAHRAFRHGLGRTLAGTLPEVQLTVGAPGPAERPRQPGLLLVPVVGAGAPVVSRSPAGPVLAHYPVRRQAPRVDAASGVVGRTRATLLTSLSAPQSTTVLAGRLGLAPSTVSYHLMRLHRSGLLERSRSGHEVHYRLSARGRTLVEGHRDR